MVQLDAGDDSMTCDERSAGLAASQDGLVDVADGGRVDGAFSWARGSAT